MKLWGALLLWEIITNDIFLILLLDYHGKDEINKSWLNDSREILLNTQKYKCVFLLFLGLKILAEKFHNLSFFLYSSSSESRWSSVCFLPFSLRQKFSSPFTFRVYWVWKWKRKKIEMSAGLRKSMNSSTYIGIYTLDSKLKNNPVWFFSLW